MKIKRLICSAASLALMLGLSVSASAQTPVGTGNPYLPLWEHLPDGEPRVFEDPDNPGKYRAYIIGSHDLEYKAYCGADIRMWSAPVEDLTNWRDEGPIFTYQVEGEWDTMFAPDLVEVNRPDGTREYYLYPHSRGANREPMVCKGSRPNGPFTPVNLTPDGKRTLPGSIIGFDPSIYVEQITDKNDPDYNIGFRAYAFWGYQISNAAQLDQNTMYSVRPGTEVKPYFLPSSARYGVIRDPEGTTYPALYKGQNPGDFNFYEASSIRKVGNKFLMIFSGYSGPDYGLSSSNSTLRYAYGDSPLGPWRSGGVLVDSRGVVLNQDGSALTTTNFGHNTHGSLEEINGHWYVFYHRPPRGYGFARQAMVAPVTIEWDEKPVAEGGKVVVRGYDPYAKDKKWEAAAANGDVYTGAEVTSEGFQVFGLDPFKYYSAGYACYFSNNNALQDSWDIWDNSMDVNMDKGDIVGFKYFGFGGLSKAQMGLKPFRGTRPGDKTAINLFLTPKTAKAFKIKVMLDGPYANKAWNGKQIAEIEVPARTSRAPQKFTADVSKYVDRLGGKHAIYLIAEGEDGQVCVLHGIGFSNKKQSIDMPMVPKVDIKVDGKSIEMPDTPVRFNHQNGYTGYNNYEAEFGIPAVGNEIPEVSASCSNPDVKISITQPVTKYGKATIVCDYKGVVKTYTLSLKTANETATAMKIVEDGGTGPYKALMVTEPSLAAHTVFRPADLSVFGKNNPLPVIVWGNGACTNSPWEHINFLSEIASHGYIVIATGYMPVEGQTNYGAMSTSEQQIESIDWAEKVNADPASPYFNKLDTKSIAAAGMSCGGLQTLSNAADKRLKTIMICNSGLFVDSSTAVPGMPMPHKESLKSIHTPVLYMLGGPEDIAYNNGMDDFKRIDHVLAVAVNYPVGHGGTYGQPHGGEFSVVALKWLDWNLKGDRSALMFFVGEKPGILQREGWSVESKFRMPRR